MFDGNYRSNRRQVDLSGGGRRRKAAAGRTGGVAPGLLAAGSGGGAAALSGALNLPSSSSSSLLNPASSSTSGGGGVASSAGGPLSSSSSTQSNRAVLLDGARRDREARARQAEQKRSSVKIQKLYRGRLSRRELCRQVERELEEDGSLVALPVRTARLNVLLGLLPATSARRNADRDPRQQQQPQQQQQKHAARLLQGYAESIRSATGASAVAGSGAVALPPPPPPPPPPNLAHRILAKLFSAVAAGQLSGDDAGAALAYVIPPSSSPASARRQLGGVLGWTHLLETLQVLGDGDAGSHSPAVAAEMWRIAVAVAPESVQGRAALGVVAFSQPASAFDTVGPTESLLRWFDGMVQVLSDMATGLPQSASSSASGTVTGTDDPIAASVLRMHPRRTSNVLRNAMALYNAAATTSPSSTHGASPAPLVRYFQLLPDRILALSSFMVQGDGFERNGDGTGNSATEAPAAANGNDEDDDDDDSDWDGSASPRARATAALEVKQKTPSTSSSRLTKQDLQTTTKIDRSYRQAVQKWRAMVTTTNADYPSRQSRASAKASVLDTELELAGLLCIPDRWLQWGKALLPNANHGDAAMEFVSANEQSSAAEALVTVLGALLQSTTGLRARDSVGSQFLAIMALDATFLEQLWKHVRFLLEKDARRKEQYPKQRQSTSPVLYVALSVFCDVFAHRLLAMRDNQFLSEYTSAAGGGGADPGISADHVVVTLRDALYELYWSKPVRAKHVVPPGSTPANTASEGDAIARYEAVRGRLLLSGTKLWQSLYERWCRLVRQAPFSDESAWWFPYMTTLSSEDKVVGMRHGRQHHAGEVEDMDLESSDDEHEGSSGPEPMAVDVENEAFADAFSDPKMARILTSIPQAFPFDRRVMLFHSLLESDKQRTQDEETDMRNAMLMIMRGEEGGISSREQVTIHRDSLYEDSMRQLNSLGPKLRKRVQVSFINQHGQGEAGIDGGGVFKEFVDDLIKEAFSVDRSKSLRLFSVTPLQTLAVNTWLPVSPELLSHYEFLGRVLGKAVYESILVEPQFCLPFLNQLLGRSNSLEDLKNFDQEFYQNLTKLLSMPAEEIAGLGLTFDLTMGEGREGTHTVELLKGGRTRSVTKSNVIQYVHLVAHQRLNVESTSQTKAFLRGFRDLIPASWVRLFSSHELQKLISGDDSIRGIDVESLKHSMQYAAGYHPSQPVISWFWEILEEMSAEQQRLFLKFMTSCSRQPLLGFSSLEPAPCIQQVRLPGAIKDAEDGAKNAPLPTSATCMNLLKLPNYWSKEIMRHKLLAAIESGAGFELT